METSTDTPVLGLLDGLEPAKGLQLVSWSADESVLLTILQKSVGGRIERVPYDTQRSSDSTLEAYVNERGISLGLQPNIMGWHVLRGLGFCVSPVVTVYGPILFLDAGDKPLSVAHQAAIQQQIQHYRVRFTPVSAALRQTPVPVVLGQTVKQ